MRASARSVGAPLQGDPTLSFTPVEPEDEAQDEFPFPHDELEPGRLCFWSSVARTRGRRSSSSRTTTRWGATPDSGVFLDDVTVSRTHATFERRDGDAWFVTDVGSLNGTYVNGEQVDETKLASGDEVQIGKFKLDVLRGRGVRCTMAGTRNYQSIGEVLVSVKTEFPDITISKIRFLEAEGLIEPERTPSGYRKFYATTSTA